MLIAKQVSLKTNNLGIHMKFEMYKDSSNQYRWRLKASNGEIIASGEAYRNRQDCINAVNLVMDTNRNTTFVEI